jgi:hypothetical protein
VHLRPSPPLPSLAGARARALTSPNTRSHIPPPPPQDLSPKYASALLGITNTAGALPGVLGVTSAGYLLDTTGSWALALFLPTVACQLFGAAFYTAFASSERQHWS